MPGSESRLRFSIHENELPDDAVAIRRRVFIEEQGVDPALELDGQDAECVHIVGYDGDDAGVSCARLRPLGDGRAKVERVAVREASRRGGLGRATMDACETEARRRGWRALELHSQLAVVDFYEGLAWRRVGEPFEEAGIPHVAMEKRLR